MLSLVIFFLAVVSTTALSPWFWEVRRKLRVHYSVVVSARGQMETFERRAAATATGDKDATGGAAPLPQHLPAGRRKLQRRAAESAARHPPVI